MKTRLIALTLLGACVHIGAPCVLPGAEARPVSILYPPPGAVFPPDFAAPQFVWRDSMTPAALWRISFRFKQLDLELAGETDGPPPAVGPLDPQAISVTNRPPELPPGYAGAHSWRPDAALWQRIKELSASGPVTVEISGHATAGAEPLSRGSLQLHVSSDPVGAPIFYRDVPLMPAETRRGIISPLAPDAIRLIRWRIRDVSKSESHVVLESLPTCANCHSFSADGKTLGMDLDGPDSDKGTYTMSHLARETQIARRDVMTWNSFPGRPPGSRTIGFMSQVSPDGQYAVSTVNEEVYTANFLDYRFLQVFYPARGILAVYSRATGQIVPLPGADDPRFVHTNAVWSPDGRSIIFARAPARDAYPADGKMAAAANDPNELPVRYDLYRIPFNGGRGGRATPIAGASANGKSNSFPKISPDGRWLVFVQSRNGQLMRPDSELYIVPASGGAARRMNCNTPLMNSWHSFSPNGRWMVFSSKSLSPYTQMFLTHIDGNGNDSPPILIENSTAANRAVNIPEFVNIAPDGLQRIDVPAAEFYRIYDKATAAANSGDLNAAIALWRQAAALEPDDARAPNNLGAALAGKSLFGEAETQFRAAIALKPGYSEAYFNLGGVLNAQGRQREAVEAWERSFSLAPGFAGDPAKAARDLAAGSSHPSKPDSWRATLAASFNDRGVASAALARFDEAEQLFLRALEADPSLAEAHYNLGRMLARRDNIGAAIARWAKALELKPDYADASFSIASAQEARGDRKPALRHWLDGLRTSPAFVPALKRAAWIMATAEDESLCDGAQALALADRAVRETNFTDAEALDILAAAYARAGEFANAQLHARSALKLTSTAQAGAIRRRLAAYEKRSAWSEPAARR